MGSCAERFFKALQNDTHLYWTPCISCEWRVLCILPRGHQQMHPAAARSFLSALRGFCQKTLLHKVGTPAEFKWCSSEWSNARRLARHSTLYGLVLIVNLKTAERLLVAWLAVFTERHSKVNSRSCVFWSFALCVLQKEIWVWLVVLLASTAVGRYSWLTCGINSLSDVLPWLDLKEDVYDWGLFLLRPPPQLPAC